MLKDILLDAIIDTLKILPFLFLTYLLIEFLEHKAEEKSVDLVNRSGKLGPIIGSALGIIPQCGFSAATSNLYSGGVITRGTLIAVFLSTSDEMLPIMISKNISAGLILKILATKFAAGILIGLLIDVIERGLSHDHTKHLHDLCEQDDCHCAGGGIVKPALIHTAKISLFLLITTAAVSVAVELVGEENLATFALNKPVAGELLAGLIGLIPNCAASVIITQLFLDGGMSTGAMLAGLLTGSGVGLLVLFRMNRKHMKDNLITLAILYVSGVVLGFVAGMLPVWAI